jgi:hypothetical protein
MKRIALIAASSVAALAATFAIAQPQPQPLPQAGGDRDSTRQERTESREQRRTEWRERRAERMQARMNERLAKLRTDMNLKPEQVPMFETVEQVIKSNAEKRREAWSAIRERRETMRHADLMERLDMMTSRSAERAARAKELSDAVRPLWATLSDEQKTVVRRTLREAMAEGRGRMHEMRERWQERRGGWDRDDDGDRGPRRWRDREYDRDGGRDRGDDWDRRG